MMKKLSLLVIMTVLMLFAVCAYSQTLDEILQNNIEARGGLEKIKSINTMKYTGKFLSMGMEFPFVTYQKRPLFFKIESGMQGMTFIQAFDGEKAWTIMPWSGSNEPKELPGVQGKTIEQYADIDGTLIDYKEKGYEVELIGKEDLEGTEVYHLKVSGFEEMVFHYYLDAEYFLELKMTLKATVDENEFELETFISDYKEVDGLMIAHSMESRMEGKTISQIVMETVEFNIPIADSIFFMPEKNDKTEKADSTDK